MFKDKVKLADLKTAIKTMQNSYIDGCYYFTLDRLPNGKRLALVIGYASDYELGDGKYQSTLGDSVFTMVGKIAFNCDDLQCDYEFDWHMPWTKDGDVVDTDMAIDGTQSQLDWWLEMAEEIVNGINNKELKTE